MYRQNSFSAKTESPHFRGGDDADAGDDRLIYLKTSGRFLNKGSPYLDAGLVAAFRNYPTRNKTWPMSTVCCNPKSGGFAIADDRGQIYKMSVLHNSYNSVRLASTGVTAMAFINQHKNHLVVAYDSGSMIVLDAHTKDIIGNLQSKSNSVARIIHSHPTELKVAIASDDKTLAIWDLK
jgi:WD40 repeat protein